MTDFTREPHVRGTCHCRASELLGADVTNARNQDLGRIHDVVLDPHNLHLAYLVLSFGGFLGMGARLLAIPWCIVEVERKPDGRLRLSLEIGVDALQAAPGFDRASWPETGDATWVTVADDYHRRRGGIVGSGAAPEPARAAWGGNPAFGRQEPQTALAQRRLSRILGTEVLDPQLRVLASLEDLIVDARGALVVGAALTFGGVLGVGERTALVPTEFLSLDGNGAAFVLPCTSALLETMALPGGVWPPLDDDRWIVQARERMCAARAEQGDARGAPSLPSARPGPPHFGASETVVGSITTIGSLRIDGHGQERLRFRLRTAEGRDVTVHAAAAACSPRQTLDLAPGRTVVVVGSRAHHGTQVVLEATAITLDGRTMHVRAPLGADGDAQP